MHLAYIWIVSHLSAKNYRNWWKFDKVLTKTNLLSFFWDTVYMRRSRRIDRHAMHAAVRSNGHLNSNKQSGGAPPPALPPPPSLQFVT